MDETVVLDRKLKSRKQLPVEMLNCHLSCFFIHDTIDDCAKDGGEEFFCRDALCSLIEFL